MHVNSDVRLVRVRSGRQYKKQPFEFDSIFFLLSFADLLVRTESLFSLTKTHSSSSHHHVVRSVTYSVGFLLPYSPPKWCFVLSRWQMQVCGQWVPTAIKYRLVPRPAGAHGASRYLITLRTPQTSPSHWICRLSYSKMAPNSLPITPLPEGITPKAAAMSYSQGSCIGIVLR